MLVTHSIEEALYLGERIIVMGEKLGNIIYEIKNPYFGRLNPESLEYLEVKRQLRERLIKKQKQEEACEQTSESM